jgi:hypothetical protein
MEKAIVIALLEKYWRAETTLEEEQRLAAYFSTPSTDPDLESYNALFAYFEEESQVGPGPDFEARILDAVAASGTPAPRIPVRRFQWSLVAAAASVLLLVSSLFLFEPAKTNLQPVANSAVANNTGANRAVATITDTYDNPEQALAAVRRALLVASIHLNEGQKQISNK